MSVEAVFLYSYHYYHMHTPRKTPLILSAYNYNASSNISTQKILGRPERQMRRPGEHKPARFRQLRPHTNGLRKSSSLIIASAAAGVPLPPLDLTEDNIRQALADARAELGQIFDSSVGITGQAELAELDGPFVKISLKGRFWHKRSTVLARVGNYLKQRIPEILEVDIEDEKQLDDSPENF